MTQPVTIDQDNRRITFQIGKVIPPTEARSNYHRLLDLALDALADSSLLPAEAAHGGGRIADAGDEAPGQ